MEDETPCAVILDSVHRVMYACMLQEVSTSDFPNTNWVKDEERKLALLIH